MPTQNITSEVLELSRQISRKKDEGKLKILLNRLEKKLPFDYTGELKPNIAAAYLQATGETIKFCTTENCLGIAPPGHYRKLCKRCQDQMIGASKLGRRTGSNGRRTSGHDPSKNY